MKTVPLNTLANITMGTAPPGETYNFGGDGLPMIAGAGDYGDLHPQAKKWTTQPMAIAQKGDLLICVRATIGDLNWADREYCLGRGVAGIRALNGHADLHYIAHYLDAAKHLLAEKGSGSTFPAIRRADLTDFPIPIPFADDPRRSLAEQKRIAAILDKADAIRRRRQEAARLADTLIPSVFYEMFGDARTNRHKWPMLKFSEVCESRLGKMLDGKQQTGEHRRPYLGNANVQWFQFHFTSIKDMDFDEADRAEFRLQDGDVLICEGGEVGRAAIWRDELPECYFQKAIHRARPRPKKATPEYVAWLMRDLSLNGGFDLVTSQATIAHLTGEKLKGLLIPVPPFELQQRFSKKVRALEAFGSEQRAATSGLHDFFNALVQRAFRGEL